MSEPARPLFGLVKSVSNVRIAVARDAAFYFYYAENLEMLQQVGAELVYFSPLQGEMVPQDIHGLYLGGGFPEQFAEQLSQQKDMLKSVAQTIQAGVPTLAEGGGLLFLGQSLKTADGKDNTYPLTGVFSGQGSVTNQIQGFGYAEVWGVVENFLLSKNEQAKGHRFHHGIFEADEGDLPAFYLENQQSLGLVRENLVASFLHLYFPSSPSIATNWVTSCQQYQQQNDHRQPFKNH